MAEQSLARLVMQCVVLMCKARTGRQGRALSGSERSCSDRYGRHGGVGLGVVVKQLRTGEPGYVHYGAYARCKKCKARGPLVRLDTKFDVRNERVGRDGRRTLVSLAVDAWNAVAVQPQGTDGLPLFENARDIDLSGVHAVCFDCAKLLGFEQKDKAVGVWPDDCGVCHQYKPCTDLWHDWEPIKEGEAK